METKTKSFVFFVRSYYIYTPQDFVTKYFLIFIVDEVKNFAANNNHSSCWSSSCTGIRAKNQSQIGDLYIKGKKATTKSSPIGYWSEDSPVGWYFEISQDNGKIPHTCNRLIIDQQILGSDGFKITQLSFCLTRNFPHLAINHHVNLIFAAFSLIGDLLVSLRFACNLTELINLGN